MLEHHPVVKLRVTLFYLTDKQVMLIQCIRGRFDIVAAIVCSIVHGHT